MAENKKGIIVYADWMDKFESLSDKEAGVLIKHFFRYVNDLNPKVPDRITELSFIDIKNSLKRDLEKWEKTIEGRSKAGKASAEKRRLEKLSQQGSTNPTNVKSVELNPTNPTDSVSVSVNVNDSVSVNDNVIKENILSSQTWIEQICMKKKLEIKDVTEYLNIFLDDLDLKGELDKPESDIKKHFINWLNIQLKNVKTKVPKTLQDKYAHLI